MNFERTVKKFRDSVGVNAGTSTLTPYNNLYFSV